MAYLELTGLEKRYRDAIAAADVSLAVEKGESVALLGPCGCGKTTTLRMLAGLAAPDRGHIALDGVDITSLPAHKRNMGYVFQSYALFPHMNVERMSRSASRSAVLRRRSAESAPSRRWPWCG